jgi:hypothetical protein
VKEGLRNQTLNVVLGGSPVQLLPSMVELIDSLPPGMMVLPAPQGEVYLKLPEGASSAALDLMLGLGPDAYRVVRAVRRRLTGAPAGSNLTEVWVEAPPALEEELRTHAVAIAQSLQVPRFEALTTGTRFIPGEITSRRYSMASVDTGPSASVEPPQGSVLASHGTPRPSGRPVRIGRGSGHRFPER